MSDLNITASSVLQSGNAVVRRAVAGATLTRGMGFYLDSTDANKAKGAINTSATAAALVGVVLNDVASGQVFDWVGLDSTFTVGATLTVGKVYAVSNTAGKFCPIEDVGSGGYVTVAFVASTAALANLAPIISGAAVP